MARYSIFSHTVTEASSNHANLHRTDIVGDKEAVTLAMIELQRRGHSIDDCLCTKETSDTRTRGRRDR